MSALIEKSILVLANSIKKSGRCIAGREITPAASERRNFGGWIRPIDQTQSEGMIPGMRTYLDSQMLKPLDCVRIRFTGPANDSNHPEDWVIDPTSNWVRDGTFESDVFGSLQDETGDLWGRESAANRRVLAGSASNTLRLVKPVNPVLVEAFHEYNSFTGRDQLRNYIKIRHQGIDHLLTVTDSFFSARHKISPSNVSKSELMRFELNPIGLVIVVSLTPPFNGYQYKVAAAIIEP